MIGSEHLKKRNNYNVEKNEVSKYLLENKIKGLFSANSGYGEKKLLASMSLKVKAFWKKENNTYPFSFKQKKIVINDNESKPILLIERQQFNYKRVNPNQHLNKN